MKIIESALEMQQAALALRARGRRIGFVPTMGNLHAGHLSLDAGSDNEGTAGGTATGATESFSATATLINWFKATPSVSATFRASSRRPTNR